MKKLLLLSFVFALIALISCEKEYCTTCTFYYYDQSIPHKEGDKFCGSQDECFGHNRTMIAINDPDGYWGCTVPE